VKTEPRHDDSPLPLPMSRGATSRSHQVGHVVGEKPKVTVSQSPAAPSNVIVIEDHISDDGNDTKNITGSDGDANPVTAITGFRAVAIASSAPDAAAVLPTMARAPAAAIEVIVLDDDSSDDDKPNPTIAVTGIGAVASTGPDAEAVQPMALTPAATAVATAPGLDATASVMTIEPPGPAAAATAAVTIPPAPAAALTIATAAGVAAPIAADTVMGNGSREAGARYSSTLDLQRHACMACDMVFPTGQALGWHRKLHYSGLMIGAASNGGSSSARPPAAAAADEQQPLELSMEAIAMNSNPATVHGSAGTMRRRSFPTSAGSAILALPALMSPVHDPPQGMAMAGNPVAGLVSAPTAATGSWSLPATTSSVHPAEIAVVPGNRGGRTIRIFGVDNFAAFPSQNQEENLPEEVAMAPGNGEHLFGFNISPPFPSQNPQEETVHVNHGLEEVAVAPGNIERRSICLFGFDASPAFPSQNQENPPHEMVPSNRGSRTIRLFGVNMAEGPKEMKK